MNKGFYHLILHLDQRAFISIGKLGTFPFLPGYYVYTGSALHSLHARLDRHRKPHKKLRWHIDYLRRETELVGIRTYPLVSGVAPASEPIRPFLRTECLLNQGVQHLPGAGLPVPGFGSSDCRCHSHLTYFETWPGGIERLSELGVLLALYTQVH